MKIKPTTLTTKILKTVINTKPQAYAMIKGQDKIEGTICFYSYLKGTILLYEINHLPKSTSCHSGIFGFHIHEGHTCLNDTDIPYKKTKNHYNPNHCHHPYHLGDLPPVFANNGIAWSMVYIDKFSIKDIIGRTIVIHANADDFHTQPSGHSGKKIACGEIKKF